MLQKRIQAKVTYYDVKLHTVVNEKNEHTITFDSRAEFKCWQLLSNTCKGCYVTHPYKVELKGGKTWRCDFAITATTTTAMQALGRLKSILLGTEYSPEFMLLLEYKGTLDDNFLKKMSHICRYEPLLFDELLLVSDKCCGYAWEDLSSLKACVKVIHSTEFLRGAIEHAFSITDR